MVGGGWVKSHLRTRIARLVPSTRRLTHLSPVSSLFSLLSSCLDSSLLVHLLLSCLVSPLSCLVLSFFLCLSFSVSLCLCLSPCGVCGFKNASVCTFTTSPCMPAPRAHLFQHVRVVQVHTETLTYTRGRVESTHGSREEGGGHRQFCLPRKAHVLQRFTKETVGSYTFSA